MKFLNKCDFSKSKLKNSEELDEKQYSLIYYRTFKQLTYPNFDNDCFNKQMLINHLINQYNLTRNTATIIVEEVIDSIKSYVQELQQQVLTLYDTKAFLKGQIEDKEIIVQDLKGKARENIISPDEIAILRKGKLNLHQMKADLNYQVQLTKNIEKGLRNIKRKIRELDIDFQRELIPDNLN